MLIIDRLEGSIAVCEGENRIMIDIDKCNLPSDAKERDCIELNENGTYDILVEITEKRKNNISERVNKLFN